MHNLVLLCSHHHHRVNHHTDWTVQIIAGRAHFHPPDWSGITGPLTNHLHHHHDDQLRH